MNMKRILCALALVLTMASCHNGATDPATTDTLMFTDDYQRTVAIPAAPLRIVSASPSVTEIVFALGAGNRLVGRTDYCLYPDEAQAIPSIGGIANLNVEQVLSLNPDLVISASMVPQQCVEQFELMKVPFVSVTEKNTFDDLYDNIAKIGRLIGCSHEADSLCRHLRQQVEQLNTTDTNTRPSLYYVVGFGKAGNFTSGGNTFIDDIITIAGARNIAHDLQGWQYSLEALMANDPDFILIRSDDSAAFCQAMPYRNLSAVRNGHVIGIASGTIDVQVPRNIDAIRLINQRIHSK